MNLHIKHDCGYPSSSFPSFRCDCVSEWSGQCTSLLDTSIRRTYCDWLHHLLPAARWRTHWLRDGWNYCHYCHHHWTNSRGYIFHYHGGHLQYTTQYCDCCRVYHYRYIWSGDNGIDVKAIGHLDWYRVTSNVECS